MWSIHGRKEQRAADIGEVRRIRTGRAGIDVLDQVGTNLGSVAGPKLDTVGVLRSKEDSAVDVGQLVRIRPEPAAVDVLNLHGAGDRTIAGPQRASVAAVAGKEKFAQLCAGCHGADGRGKQFEAVWWDGVEKSKGRTLAPKTRIELAYTPEANTWQGNTRLQLVVEDLRIS